MAYFKLLQTLFLLASFSFSVLLWNGAQAYECLHLIKTEGYTYPVGDIPLEFGEDLNITCVLNDAAVVKFGPFASEKMSFIISNRSLPAEILNSTAIRLHIQNHPKTPKTEYYCLINNSLVCHNAVVVGTEPANITDFDCMGHNLENFTCTWTVPENYVNTQYELEYAPSVRSSRYKNHKGKSRKTKPKATASPSVTSFSQCPNPLNEKKVGNKTIMSCTWALSTTPQYRHSHANFTFNLYANNTFGKRNWTYLIPHYSRVRPNPPERFRAISTTPHSIKLEWQISMYMQNYPDGLRYRVSWCIEQSKQWTTIYLPDEKYSDLFHVDQPNISFILDKLPYAHFLYDIRVSIQPKTALDDRMWSQNVSATIRTLSEIPDCPPNTTLGSFEILDGIGKRYIYWQNIHSYQENGDNFTYYIEAVENSTIEPVNVYKKYAVFNNIPDINVTFQIWSENSEGRSRGFSTVFVPAPKFALKPIRKLIKEDKGNGVYNLQWIDSGDVRVSNYTLFWCSAQMERPYPCDGTLHWVTVPRGSKNKTLSLPVFDHETNKSISNYQFAISANGVGTSSGLLWADCTVLSGSGKRKLSQTYVKKVSSRYMLLQIHLGCITLTDIQGFNVSYCKILTPESEECQPNSLKFKFFDIGNDTFGGEEELNITNLTPYTGYQIRVKPIVKGAEIEFGDSMFNSTIEDTPSEPRNLRILRRAARNLTIQWDSPAETNGHLIEYHIRVTGRGQTHPITVIAANNVETYSRNITDLIPRSSYVIGVSACTSSCSKPALINTSTDINVPGLIQKPSANWDNFTTIIKWEKPDEPQTVIDYYELEIGTYYSETLTYQNATNEFYSLGKICEGDTSQTIYVRVRGVNKNDSQLLKGNWSDNTDFPCIRSASAAYWIISLIALSTLIIVIVITYTAKRTMDKVGGMRHCPVKLPPGIDTVSNVEYSMAEIQEDKQSVTSIRAPGIEYRTRFAQERDARNISYVLAGHPPSTPPMTFKQAPRMSEGISTTSLKVPNLEALKLLFQNPDPQAPIAGYVLVGDGQNEKSEPNAESVIPSQLKTETLIPKVVKTIKED